MPSLRIAKRCPVQYRWPAGEGATPTGPKGNGVGPGFPCPPNGATGVRTARFQSQPSPVESLPFPSCLEAWRGPQNDRRRCRACRVGFARVWGCTAVPRTLSLAGSSRSSSCACKPPPVLPPLRRTVGRIAGSSEGFFGRNAWSGVLRLDRHQCAHSLVAATEQPVHRADRCPLGRLSSSNNRAMLDDSIKSEPTLHGPCAPLQFRPFSGERHFQSSSARGRHRCGAVPFLAGRLPAGAIPAHCIQCGPARKRGCDLHSAESPTARTHPPPTVATAKRRQLLPTPPPSREATKADCRYTSSASR